MSLSLQSKILVSHFLLAMVLVGTLHLVRNASWAMQALVAGGVTLVLALLLPAVLARVTRLRVAQPQRARHLARGPRLAGGHRARASGATRSTS